MSDRRLSSAFRSSVVRGLMLIVLLGNLSRPSLAQRGGPGGPGVQPAPLCPEYAIGQFNGIWFYVTSNCMGGSGYGESLSYYGSSQCGEDGICINPVAPVGIGDGSVREIPQEEIDRWIADVEATLARLQRAEASSLTSPDRRARIRRILPFTRETLNGLRGTESATQKEYLYTEFQKELSRHEKAWSIVGFAPGASVNLNLQDTPTRDEPVSVAETKFDTAEVDPEQARVTATQGPLLKVERAGGETPVYYQCYTVEVRRLERKGHRGLGRAIELNAPPKPLLGTDILSIGIEVRPTEAEAKAAVKAEFSERGRFAHRLRGPGNRPWLVKGTTNLEL